MLELRSTAGMSTAACPCLNALANKESEYWGYRLGLSMCGLVPMEKCAEHQALLAIFVEDRLDTPKKESGYGNVPAHSEVPPPPG